MAELAAWIKADRKNELSRYERRSMNRLNNDCLLHVFQYLSIEDRLRMEIVCRRWRDVSRGGWPNVRSLTVAYSRPELNSLLRYCCKFLTKVVFSAECRLIVEQTLEDMVARCPNLQMIDVEALHIRTDLLDSLTTSVRSLRSLAIGPTDGHCDTALIQLCRRHAQLQELSVVGNRWFSGACVGLLRELKILRVRRCRNIRSDFLSFIGSESLESLELDDPEILPSSINDLANRCSSIKSLVVGYNSDEGFDESLINLCRNNQRMRKFIVEEGGTYLGPCISCIDDIEEIQLDFRHMLPWVLLILMNKCTRLRSLIVSNTFRDDTPESARDGLVEICKRNRESLRSLDVSKNFPFNNRTAKYLANLESLTIQHCCLPRAIDFSKMPHLRELSLIDVTFQENFFKEKTHPLHSIRNSKSLRCLSLLDSDFLLYENLKFVGKRFQMLEELRLGGAWRRGITHLNNAALEYVARMPRLKKLVLSDVWLTRWGFTNHFSPSLRALHLENFRTINFKAVAQVIENAPRLVYLYLSKHLNHPPIVHLERVIHRFQDAVDCRAGKGLRLRIVYSDHITEQVLESNFAF